MQRVENIVAEGEIALLEQFHLLSLCFQKSSAGEVTESIMMLERVICMLELGVKLLLNASYVLQVNPNMVEKLEDRGMKFVGRSEDGERMEIMELEGILIICIM